MAAEICVREARLALMSAALRATTAREARDDVGLAFWRERADEARRWLRSAHEREDGMRLEDELEILRRHRSLPDTLAVYGHLLPERDDE